MKDLSHITEDQCKEIAKIVSPVFYSPRLSGQWDICTHKELGIEGRGGFRIRNPKNDYELDFDFETPQDIELLNRYTGDDLDQVPISGGKWYEIFNKLNDWGLYLKQKQETQVSQN